MAEHGGKERGGANDDPVIGSPATRNDAKTPKISIPADRRLSSRLSGRLVHWQMRLGGLLLLEFENGRGFLWLPVGMALGIGIYFVLPREPFLAALALLVAVSVFAARRVRLSPVAFPAVVFLAALAVGLLAAKMRTEWVSAPRLEREQTVTVVGWVEQAERSGERVRMILRVASLSGGTGQTTPRRVRISVRRSVADGLQPGDGVSLRARLRPPQGPVIPGGYDFARAQFFAGIGATGFGIGKIHPASIGTPPISVALAAAVHRWRGALSRRIEETLTGDAGAVASALIVGHRRGISEEVEEALRRSGLAHILAISGLHMALVAGAVFWSVRAVLALFPAIALSRPIRKWAAVAALISGAFYLVLSGAGIATQRAFIMIAIVFIAIIAERPAVTLRSVALAAIVVMAVAPETVVGPSFQMSFAAVVALVATYEWHVKRDRHVARSGGFSRSAMRVVLLYFGGLLMTSLIAGLATAPFAAFHFNRVAPLGLVANLAAMPVVAFWIMPIGVLAMLSVPFGLDPLLLPLMGWGIDQVVAVARTVAEMTPGHGVVGRVPTIAAVMLTGGLLWLALWQTRLRFAGIVAIAAGVMMAVPVSAPDLLVSADGRLAALRGIDGRLVLPPGRRSRFTVENWLRADGDPRSPGEAAPAEHARCDRLGCVLGERPEDVSRRGLIVAIVKRPLAFEEDCRVADVIVTGLAAPPDCARHAIVFDKNYLTDTGALSVWFDRSVDGPGRAKISALERAIPKLRRPWHPIAARREPSN